MTLLTYEGVVQKGSILLNAGVQLPENAKVYIIVTEEVIPVTIDGKRPIQILSPHFAAREDAAHFEVSVIEEKPNGQL
ncbi:MAG: hypothetical protein DCC59_17575 [Chloroflexi bacterium]|nr:hypothetical protein [Chloroflexi bacterium CFX1]MCK6568708.1 hypothetical protein [Anaerolineales bacterium]MCQ3953550.1 hypothetical protein [Chloroflexota bacterium]NUQ58835.1 hypothetical protein [Anaerolineales bacterium]RIK45890.1 MAG: hypothetical protein DCC59_17575 [Chloroflexota bacterium]